MYLEVFDGVVVFVVDYLFFEFDVGDLNLCI